MNKLKHEDLSLEATGSRLENDVSHVYPQSRRSFLQSALAAAGLLLVQELKAFPESAVLRTMAPAVTVDLVHDTLNGLAAFVVPGPDAYSVAQGVSTPEPGAIAAFVTEIFIPVLDG